MTNESNKIANLARRYINTTQKHLFLTGKAGTGKTTFLTEIKNNTFKNVVVAAPTGIAAIQAGGVTLHSLFHLPFGMFVPDNRVREDNINTPQSVLATLKMNKAKRSLLCELELLIIDEVSMLRADLLDCIDVVLKSVRRKQNLPFGGVQLLLIGDLYQLPPVVKNYEWQILSGYYPSLYFFNAQALQQAQPVYLELDKIYRQTDQPFIDLLNRLRNNQLSNKDISSLNELYKPNFKANAKDGYVYITTHNYKADAENQSKLDELPGKSTEFNAVVKGDFPTNMYPASESLHVKPGAQIMFIKNDPSGDKKYYNGKIGTLEDITSEKLTILWDQGQETIELEPVVWENIKYKMDKETGEIDEQYLGSFTQFPIRLAWAITVHKSQGLTFNKAILDLSDVFAPGQMYVALSRLSSLKGLVLASPLQIKDFNQDEALQKFSTQHPRVEELEVNVQEATKQFLNQYISSAFYLDGLMQELQFHLSGFSKKESRSEKQQYVSWTKIFLQKVSELNEIAKKFRAQITNILLSDSYLDILNERVSKASNYFLPLLNELFSSLQEHQNLVGQRKRIKGYLGELKEIAAAVTIKILAIEKAQLVVNELAKGNMVTKQQVRELYKQAELKKPAKKVKKLKVPTAEISFNLYQQGKTIAEIAQERGLVEGTIIGHLCAYIANGRLEASNFIENAKLNKIVDKAVELDTRKSSEIKGALNDAFSYKDIKIALAHIASME